MKLRLFVRNTLAAFAALGALAGIHGRAFAQNTNPLPTSIAGLHVGLSTGGYKFVIPPDPAVATLAAASSPASFPATATIYNRSSTDINFTFPDPGAAQRKFTFRVFDAAGVQVWQSDGDVVAAAVLTDAKLARGSRWSRTAMIPLKPGGTALAPGVYSLDAVIDADKKPGAASIFEVAALPDPTQEQGINGLVLKPTPSEAANLLPSEIPAAGALISVVEMRTKVAALTRPPFVWSGKADDAGKFSVKTPAGRFRVTATLPGATTAAAGATITVPTSRSVDVTVDAGKFSEVTIHLPAAPPPPVVQGIHGLVLYGPIMPVTVEGVPNEAPAAGARVVIEEVVATLNPTSRLPFRWAGITNAKGVFEVQTPAGKFKVTATLGGGAAPGPGVFVNVVAPPSASADVAVEAGKFSDVTLHIDTGLR